MKWQQHIRDTTGLSCWQIMLHLLIVAALVIGWKHGALVKVGLGLCVGYGITVILMLAFQRHHCGWQRNVGDVLEELTTTWYFGAALIAWWLIARVVHNPFLLAFTGLALLAGPALVSLLTKDSKRSSGDFPSKHSVRR